MPIYIIECLIKVWVPEAAEPRYFTDELSAFTALDRLMRDAPSVEHRVVMYEKSSHHTPDQKR